MYFSSKPEIANIDPSEINPDAIGWLATEYEPFKPSSKSTQATPKGAGTWKTVVPKNGPPAGDLQGVVKRLIKTSWNYTEPKAGAVRGNIIMGTHGVANPVVNNTYHPQTRLSGNNIPVKKDESAIAKDWHLMENIQRTNAVTFRGDKRTPHEVITKAMGFYPPSMRTDRYYLENGIYNGFSSYYQGRYNQKIDKADFLRAVDSSAPSETDKQLLINYMTWRMLIKREEAHLARMASNELLKGYISTSRSLNTSINFSTFASTPGWVYLVIVHQGFVIPSNTHTTTVDWGTQESEIAQWGPIPAERIVGFRYYRNIVTPVGPIFMSRKFRKSEPEAFKAMYDAFSGIPNHI